MRDRDGHVGHRHCTSSLAKIYLQRTATGEPPTEKAQQQCLEPGQESRVETSRTICSLASRDTESLPLSTTFDKRVFSQHQASGVGRVVRVRAPLTKMQPSFEGDELQYGTQSYVVALENRSVPGKVSRLIFPPNWCFKHEKNLTGQSSSFVSWKLKHSQEKRS